MMSIVFLATVLDHYIKIAMNTEGAFLISFTKGGVYKPRGQTRGEGGLLK